jgi:MFS transporter, OFA family, oxalate/formate antiporter
MAICPYFDQDQKFCDVGEDYISPYDVVAMSHYCSSRYRECEKFPSLTERYPDVLAQAGLHSEAPQHAAGAQPVYSDAKPLQKTTAEMVRVPLAIKFDNKWPLFHRLNRVLSIQQSNVITPEEREVMQPQTIKNRGKQVVFAGLGINLALGILYAYSMLKGEIDKLFTGSG